MRSLVILALSALPCRSQDVPALLEALDAADPAAQAAAVEALRRAGPGRWPDVARGLEHGKPSVRAGTLLALREAFEEPVVDALIRACANPQLPAETRAGAVAVLAGLHRKPAPSGAKTVEWPGTPRVLEALRSAFRDGEPAVRQAAAAGAGEARDPGSAAVLSELFWEEKVLAVRRAMLRALSALEDPAAGEIAAKILKDAATHAALLGEAIEAARRAEMKDLPEILIAIVDASDSAAVLLPAIEGLGVLQVGAAALEKRLRHGNAAVAVAAATALVKIGGPPGFQPLVKAADDPRLEVRRGVLAALASFQHQDALPSFLKAYLKPETRSSALIGMASTSDLRMLDFYIEGLASEEAEVREKSRRALALLSFQGRMGLDPRPPLERKLAAGILSREVRLELQSLYVQSQPMPRWNVLGPLPPGRGEPFDITMNDGGLMEGDYQKVYTGVGTRDVKWIQADDGRGGYMDLAARLGPSPEAVAYASASIYTPKARSAEFRVGAAGTVAVWIGGKLAHERKVAREWRSADEIVRAVLQPGVTHLMIRCGRAGKEWGFSLHLPAEPAGKLLEPPPAKQDVKEVLAAAEKLAGAAAKGKALFADLQGARCAQCHLTEEAGEEVVRKAGPSLHGVGARLGRKELAESILLPSLKVKEEWKSSIVTTRDQRVHHGAVDESVLDQLSVNDREGNIVNILSVDVVHRFRTDRSPMPEGLNLGLSSQDVADLVSWLETLK